MSPLALLIWIAVAFVVAALVLWSFLLLHRVRDNAKLNWNERTCQEWLSRLLEALEDEAALERLPMIGSDEEMDVVLGLLRDLADRFRGQYREQLSVILRRIGAEKYGMKMIAGARPLTRVRGCALLAWTGPSGSVDERLLELLDDRSSLVRLEASHALASRRAARVSVLPIFRALRETKAIHSDRVRDMLRLLAPGRAEELNVLLEEAKTPREKVLLIDGLAISGDLTRSPQIAKHLGDNQALVRVTAIRALEQLGDPSHTSAVLQLVGDADRRVRQAVARYASVMSQVEATDRSLETLALDSDFDVQRTAIYGLVKLGGSRLAAALQAKATPPIVEALFVEASHALGTPLPIGGPP